VKKFFGFFFRNNSLLLLIALSAVSLTFIKMEQADVLQRINTAGTAFRAAIADKIASYGYLIDLKNENDRLLETNIALIGRILATDNAIRTEADRSRILSGTAEQLKNFTLARVVDRQFSNRENMLLIDGGLSRGIRTDMTVMTPRGLVGRVVAVSEHYAKVMPLIHADFRASVVSSESGTMLLPPFLTETPGTAMHSNELFLKDVAGFLGGYYAAIAIMNGIAALILIKL